MNLMSKISQYLQETAATQTVAPLQSLFRQVLRWDRAEGTKHTLKLGDPLPQAVIAEPVAKMNGLRLYLIRWPEGKLPGVTARRAVQRALAPLSTEHLVCYVTNDGSQLAFTWPRRLSNGKIELRTLPYEVGSPARTTLERLAELEFRLDELEHVTISTVLEKVQKAFSVEAVTERFFRDYQLVFDNLQKLLYDQRQDRKWAHDYALQLLNRLMFLYFIQRKRWFGDNPRFLYHFWTSYKRSQQEADSFFERWLKVLFFQAFNKRFHGGYHYFPEDIRNVLQMAPYLNGGLFRENDLDRKYPVHLPDAFFVTIFDSFNGSTPGFLERYNFTISESTPLDVEVAVDPEMIGKVYESLVNITTEGLTELDLRGSAGIFYTPRVEIDLMCRLALVDALSNHLGEENRSLLYDLVFATEPTEKEQADRAIRDRNLWPQLNDVLRKLTVCDPACGSGSFLVGMLLVLDDLQARANLQLGIEETAYERRRRIIGEQLYGVDVMDWAVHVAELRLWLQLVVETELHPGELILRPLLPNLSFKIRRGDSLVQEIGGLNFGLHRRHLDLPPALRGKLTQLKGKKLHFYYGEEGLQESALRQEELQIFREVLEQVIHQKQNELAKLQAKRRGLEVQGRFASMLEAPSVPERQPDWEAQIAEVQAAIERYRKAHAALSMQEVPFVWDIAFVEIFEGEAGGFDIVIGNPPYVRQERIAPPGEREEDYTPDAWRRLKAEYKEKLQRSVAMAWPQFFQYRAGSDKFRKPDGKSDLYVYFYFHGLSLLNERGSFCFITSNSWLDVGYGADLQEFLLKHGHIKLILDNERKRSFAQADVNTVIVLLGPAKEKPEDGAGKIARFVMFKAPFEAVMSAATFKQIEAVTDRARTETYRVTARSQKELLEEGTVREAEEEAEAAETARRSRQGDLHTMKPERYEAAKWGGKYLRAPDIFFTILEKGKGKLVRLGDIAEVRRGFTTGANEFFYLEPTGKPAPAGYLHVRNGAGWEGEIEEAFLKPVIKSPREVRTIVIRPEDLRYKIFMCHEEKAALRGTAALEYIQWGERQGYHLRPSCQGRPRWWDVGVRRTPDLISPSSVNDMYRAFLNVPGVWIDKRLYEIYQSPKTAKSLALSLNCIITTLFLEVGSRTSLGEGLLDLTVYELANSLVVNPLFIANERIFSRPIMPIFDEIHQPDRRALDEVVFDVLGLTAGEREAVYEAVVSLVRARLEKAKSL